MYFHQQLYELWAVLYDFGHIFVYCFGNDGQKSIFYRLRCFMYMFLTLVKISNPSDKSPTRYTPGHPQIWSDFVKIGEISEFWRMVHENINTGKRTCYCARVGTLVWKRQLCKLSARAIWFKIRHSCHLLYTIKCLLKRFTGWMPLNCNNFTCAWPILKI